MSLDAFDQLRQRGAIKAIVEFSGGNDQGGVDGITLFFPPAPGEEEPRKQELEVYYDGAEMELVNGKWQQRPKEQTTADQELSLLLQQPVDDEFGTWCGDFDAYGTLEWDVETKTRVWDKYVQSGYDYEHEVEHG